MGILTQAELEKEIRAGSFRAVYLLLGPEAFLRRQALMHLRKNVLTPEALSLNYSEFSLRTSSLADLLKSVQTFPFASPHRLIVGTELEALHSGAQSMLLEYLSHPFGKAILVLDAQELDRRTSFYRVLRDKACVVEFPSLKGMALERWAEQCFRTRGLRISTAALKKLIALSGSHLQSLSGEIEKLALFAGVEKMIPDSAVDDLVLASRQHGIFELTGAIGRKDRPAALCLLGNLLDSGEQPLGILAMIARHFRQLLIAKEMLDAGKSSAEVGTAAQIPAFMLDEFLRQARVFDWVTTRRIYERLAGIDNRIKSTRVDPRILFDELICSI